MFKNYFILNRIVYELNELLCGQKIQEAYTQDKNKLYFRISSEEYPNRHLIISIDQNTPFISIKNEHHKAKKNTFSFIPEAFPTEISEFEISETDRCIRINFAYNSMFFFLRGNKTNLLFVDADKSLTPFKKISSDEAGNLLEEFESTQWTSSFNLPDLSEIDEEPELDSLRKSFPTLGSEIIREMKLLPHKATKNDLSQFITDIATKRMALFYSDELSKYVLIPETSVLLRNAENIEYFDTALEAVNKFLISNYKLSNRTISQKEVSKYLDKELSHLATKLNKLKKRVEEGSKEEEFKHFGSLLLANLHTLQKGMTSIKLFNYTSENEVEIKLKEKISPNKNVDYYFEKSKDEKINYRKSVELFNNTSKRYDELLKVKTDFENSIDLRDLEKIKERLRIKPANKKSKMEENIKYREYIIDSKYTVFVGKDNRNNDLVTFKMAKQNDLWFHARGVPGSHVVLRIDNTSEVTPKNIIKKVAALAAFYSKAKTAGTVPVSYTFRKFVRKKKGMEPGKVIIEKESVILVRPEIPQGCEYSEE